MTSPKRLRVDVAAWTCFGVAVLWWWRARPFLLAIEGESMSPTLEPGDLVVGTIPRAVGVGALVVVDHPWRPDYEMVKRVSAVPGQRVGDMLLGRDEYWIVGDSEASSTDSRSFGPVVRDGIKGVVRLRYWPPARVGWCG
jgi:nickel-type superoxide dismutase maturation protease